MVAFAIIISSDSSDESVGSLPSRVILFGDIPNVILSTSVISLETSAIAPVISSATSVVKTTIVASPTGLCGLVPYSDSDSDSPDEMSSLEYITPLLATSTFLFIYSSEDSDPSEAFDSSKAPPSLTWRRVSLRSSNYHPSSSSLPTDSSPVHSSGLDAPESSSGGSTERPLHSSPHSARPSHKRCRFRDSYSFETTIEKDTKIDTTETEDSRELNIVDGDDVRDHIKIDPRDDRDEFEASAGDTIMLRIDPRSVPMVDEEIVEPVGGDSSSSFGTRDGTVRSVEDILVDLDGAIRDFYHHMSEVRMDRIVRIETT
nr:hypothetical protein [Tanacetum cinerariifolium]